VKAAVFLDRDGVLTRLVPDPISGQYESPLTLEQVTLLPGAAAAVRRLRDVGYVVVGISNQPAAAKGVVELGELEIPGSGARAARGREPSPGRLPFVLPPS